VLDGPDLAGGLYGELYERQFQPLEAQSRELVLT